MDIREWAGSALGVALTPLLTTVAFFRRARVFHPTGWCWTATVTPVAKDGAAGAAAERLAGKAIIRFSTGTGKELGKKPDILGCAVRFRRDEPASEQPGADDHDLMTATFESTDKFDEGKAATDQDDLLAIPYNAITPFRDADLGGIKIRLVPRGGGGAGEGAVERLELAAAAGEAALTFEVRRKGASQWIPIVDILIDGPVELDQGQLRFHPFRNGRGIEPTGWLNSVRRAAYPASQLGRPSAG